MPSSAITRLLRVLDLEEKQGWRNRAVIGGLEAMGERWQEDANNEAVAADLVEAATALMIHYGTVAPRARAAVIEKIRMVLAGDVEDYDELLDGVIERDEIPDEDEDEDEVDAYVDDLDAEFDEEEEFDGDEDEDEEEKEDVEEDEEDTTGGAARGPADGRAAQRKGAKQTTNYGPPEATNVARTRVRKQKKTQQKQARPARTPHDLQASPTLLNGVGEATAEQLARLGINRVVDLLWHLPVRHEDYSELRTIDKLEPGEQVTIIANVWDLKNRKVGINREMVQAILGDGTGTLHATWWNKYIVKQLKPNTTLRFSGKVGLYMGQKTLDNPVFEDADADMVATGRLAPVYRLTEGLSHKRMRELIFRCSMSLSTSCPTRCPLPFAKSMSCPI
ncbi:MAG: hypothetical protein R2867_21705 [Caldilineaceae bacterium]